jgi:hypothetical protein
MTPKRISRKKAQAAGLVYYNLAQAAALLGYSSALGLRYHVYHAKTLQPSYIVSGSLAFTPDDLERFKAAHRSDPSESFTLPAAADYLGLTLGQMRGLTGKGGPIQPDGKRAQAKTYSRASLDVYRLARQMGLDRNQTATLLASVKAGIARIVPGENGAFSVHYDKPQPAAETQGA